MADTPDSTDASSGGDASSQKTSIRETLSSIAIAFAMAFIFRAFVIEAFVIPTGSMAPTLLGKHMEHVGMQTGARWQIGPWDPSNPSSANAAEVVVHDPMTTSNPRQLVESGPSAARRTADEIRRRQGPLRLGDRILVLKYLPPLFAPSRFDVVVFKNPTDPTQNYIKRLTGLPGEQLAVVDGDIFTRDAASPPSLADRQQPGGTWAMDGWAIARKPELVQRTVWMPVHDTSFAPLDPIRDGFNWYRPPWRGESVEGEPDPAWSGLDGRTPAYDGAGETVLRWDHDAWPIVDHYPYNERYREAVGGRLRPVMPPTFGVGDVRVRAGVEPTGDPLRLLELRVDTRSHAFRARLEDGEAVLESRPLDAEAGSPWTRLDANRLEPLPPGGVTDVEFWHADQAVWLFVGGRRIAYAEYDWGPLERVEHATGFPLETVLPSMPTPENYPSARPTIRIVGGVRLHRLGLDRDLYYQTTRSNSGAAVRGGHPSADLALMDDRQYFVCGDNSASSQDSRLMTESSGWVTPLEAPDGIVPEELMMGKTFFVYFPALEHRGRIPVPGFGRMRFVW
ncbi:MAG: S26 family signal peptidase [Planctomycetota bacterium]